MIQGFVEACDTDTRGSVDVNDALAASSLDGLCKCPIDDEVGAGDAARDRACKENDAGGDFLRRAHASGRIERHRRLVEIGHAALDILPDSAFKIGVAG